MSNRRRPTRRVRCAGALMLLLGCIASLADADAQYREADIVVASSRFRVQIAETLQQRTRGLMYREALASDTGMLFINPTPQATEFWMRNMRIALDILYFDEHGELLQIYRAVPPCSQTGHNHSRPVPPWQCPRYPAGGPIKYVLEVNAGTVAELGLKSGDRLRILGPVPPEDTP